MGGPWPRFLLGLLSLVAGAQARGPLLLAKGLAGDRRGARNAAAAGSAGNATGTAYSHRVRLENYMGVQYFAPFTIGGQELSAIYDTGSFEIIALSSLCANCKLATTSVYNADMSRTFQPGERKVAQHHFGSGSVLSKKGLETVRLGGKDSPLEASGMPFWQVIDHYIDVWDEKAKFSAIIGLGHTDRVPSMDGNVGNKGDLTLLQRVGVDEFAICLERGKKAPGWLRTGPDLAALRSRSSFTSVNVLGQAHWAVTMSKVAPGVAAFEPCDPGCGAIVDSGTSLIAAPPQALTALAGVIASVKEDCSNIGELPDISFRLDGKRFVLPPSAWVLQVEAPVSDNATVWDMVWGPPKVKLANQCMAGFMPLDETTQFGPMWILGMPFLRQYFTVFDRRNKKMHMAPSGTGCEPQASSFAADGRAAGFSRVRRSVEDITPTRVDLSAVRLPAWARGRGGAVV